MKPYRLAALSIALLTALSLVGCDNNDKPQAVKPTSSAAATPAKPAQVGPDAATLGEACGAK